MKRSILRKIIREEIMKENNIDIYLEDFDEEIDELIRNVTFRIKEAIEKLYYSHENLIEKGLKKSKNPKDDFKKMTKELHLNTVKLIADIVPKIKKFKLIK